MSNNKKKKKRKPEQIHEELTYILHVYTCTGILICINMFILFYYTIDYGQFSMKPDLYNVHNDIF